MRKKMLIKMFLALVFVCSLATNAFAFPKGPEPVNARKSSKVTGPFAFAYSKDRGLATPRDFYLNIAFLLMQAKEEGLEYGISLSNSNGAYPNTEGKIYGLGFNNKSLDWNCGFRLSAGTYLNHDAWDLSVAWTYLRIKNDRTSSADTMGALLLNPNLVPSSNNEHASLRWTADYNTLDFKLAKPYHISRYVIFNPHFGVRFAWIRQTFTAEYSGSWDRLEGTGSVSDPKMNSHQDFWGIGPRIGINTEWQLLKGWFLFSNVAASVLCSDFDLDQDSVETKPHVDDQTMTLNSDICLGLAWSTYFNKNHNYIALSVAYEVNTWFDQNRLIKGFEPRSAQVGDTVSRGNLYVHGLVFNVGFEF